MYIEMNKKYSLPLVGAEEDLNEIKIYINGYLHLQYKRDGHVGIKSYIDGKLTQSYWIDIINANATIQLSYTSMYLWQEILIALEDLI